MQNFVWKKRRTEACRSWTYQCRFSEEKGIFRSVNGKHTVTQLYGKGENELSTTKYVEGENLISGEWNLKFTVNTDASNNQTYEVNAENNGFKVSKVVKVPASTYLYLEVPETYENVQMIITDADGNALEKFGGTFTDPEHGVYQIKLQFEQTDTDQIHVQVVDMDQSTNDNLVMVAEMTADLN